MKEKRNGNVEAFRTVLMAGIVALHILGHGHLLELSSGPAEKVLWLIESLAYPSVNCFVIITGYYQSQNSFKLHKVISLMAQMLFWSIGCYCIYMLAGGVNTWKGMLQALLPWLVGDSWFAIVYLALYLVSPFLNAFTQNTNQKQMMMATAVLVICGCTPILSDKLGIYAMTLPWFVVLYFVGASLRMYPPQRRPLAWTGLFTLSVMGLWMSRIASFPGQSFAASNLFWRYNSFAALGAAVAAFLCVLWCPVRMWPKWVYGVSSVTFGIYLIHDHADLRRIIWDRWVSALLPAQITLKEIWLMPVLLVVIFMVCAIMESGRQKLFSALHAEELFIKLTENIKMRLNK